MPKKFWVEPPRSGFARFLIAPWWCCDLFLSLPFTPFPLLNIHPFQSLTLLPQQRHLAFHGGATFQHARIAAENVHTSFEVDFEFCGVLVSREVPAQLVGDKEGDKRDDQDRHKQVTDGMEVRTAKSHPTART